MTIYYIKIRYYFFIFIIIFPVCGLFAQEGPFISWQPELSVTWRVQQRWQANIKAVTFNTFREPDPEQVPWAYSLNNAEISIFGTYRAFVNKSFSLGYLIRWLDPLDETPGFEHRLMAQAGFITSIGVNRYGNRIRLEQRWRPAGLIHRWRYRLSLDLPLNGEVLDPGEMYLIISDEFLYSFSKRIVDFGENRLNGGVGWLFTGKSKLEISLQYRVSSFLKEERRHAFVMLSTFYLNF